MTDWRDANLMDDAISLRPWESADLVAAFRSEELARYFGRTMGGEPPPEDPDAPMYAIVAREPQLVVGRIWCRRGARPPEVGYFLREDAWGRGFATRALTLITEWLLIEGGHSEVVLCTHPANAASQRVALRCGFTRDGVVEDYALFKDGTRAALRFVRPGLAV